LELPEPIDLIVIELEPYDLFLRIAYKRLTLRTISAGIYRCDYKIYKPTTDYVAVIQFQNGQESGSSVAY